MIGARRGAHFIDASDTTGEPTGPGSSLHDAFLTLLGVITALHVALFFWYLKASMIRQPYWDMYSWVLHYLDYRRDGGWWTYLWAPHDVHRPIWIRLLTALDIELFSGVSYPFIVFTTACHLAAAWLLWRECRLSIGGRLGQAIGYLALMLMLTSVAAVDCGVPLGNGYVHVLGVSVFIIVFFAGDGPGAIGGHSLRWPRAAALLAAVTAPFASAVGWCLWPILVWMSWREGTRAWTVTVIVVGALLFSVYVRGLSLPLEAALADGEGGRSVDLLATVNYVLTYLGLPWTRSSFLSVPGRVTGALFLVLGIWTVVRHGFLRPSNGRLERIAVALVMFSLGSMVLAAAGRTGVVGRDDVLVPVRYSVLLTPLHIGLLWIAYPHLSRWLGRRVAMAIGLASALLVVQQVAAGQAAAATASRMRATIDRFVAGESDPAMTSVIYVDLNQARLELEIMRRAGVYLDVK